ncbi:hypothetical protein J2T23_001925 [Pseudarthrobacter niigatensis]|uniref:Uncharacterized protein n=1 Tax=Pseudarthrobacter niigatensis TaxID=369935 RepID=A0AAJ1SRX9_9MICC|nr:hypothetical protein [Pseudarthrobacter niigatensis]MDQ0266240.1 hypothetical protein [Pseudarthrobacter niigatensis]
MQPDGVARRRGIENNVVVLAVAAVVGKQACELVEGGDLGGARTGEALRDPRQLRVRKDPAGRANDPLPVGLGSLLRVDLQGPETWHAADRGDSVAHLLAEHLANI